MTGPRKPVDRADICRFLCMHGPATFTFGMSIAGVRSRMAGLAKLLSEREHDPVEGRHMLEDHVRESIEHGHHERRETQPALATSLIWLTTTSEEAAAMPDARGFVLEFSDSPLSSRNPLHFTVAFATPGYRPTGRFVHYWTELTAGEVQKHCERRRAQVLAKVASMRDQSGR